MPDHVMVVVAYEDNICAVGPTAGCVAAARWSLEVTAESREALSVGAEGKPPAKSRPHYRRAKPASSAFASPLLAVGALSGAIAEGGAPTDCPGKLADRRWSVFSGPFWHVARPVGGSPSTCAARWIRSGGE